MKAFARIDSDEEHHTERKKVLVGYFPSDVTIFKDSFLISPPPVADENVHSFALSSIYYQGEEYIMPDLDEIISVEPTLGIIKLEPNNQLPPGLYEINLEVNFNGEKRIIRRAFSIRILPPVTK
ncbi:MAG: hypothetical protein NZM38_01840 [Cytophagales bacterium]|nr:hypothetical protein [Cytophagales bacterium]MDW8383494.1 hypothetical protein [Flammeovirgaceae bacterium]